MGVRIKVLDPTPDCPASVVAEQTLGSFRDPGVIRRACCSGTLFCCPAHVLLQSFISTCRDVRRSPGLCSLAWADHKQEHKSMWKHSPA